MTKIRAYYFTPGTCRYPFVQLVLISTLLPSHVDHPSDLPVAIGIALHPGEIPADIVCESCNLPGCDAVLETGNEMPNNDGEFGDPYHAICILRGGDPRYDLSPILPMNMINLVSNDE